MDSERGRGHTGWWMSMACLFVLIGGCSRESADPTTRPDKVVREWGAGAALALGEWGLDIHSQDSAARLLRIRLLIQAGAVEEALQEYLKLWRSQRDPHPEILRGILNAFLEEEVQAGGISRLRAAPLVAQSADPADLPLLYDLASKGDPAARSVAVDALSRLGSGDTISFLSLLLKDPAPYARAQAARALGRLRAEVSKEDLYRLLQDEWEAVRVAAAEALARLGDHRADSVLLQALRSPQASIRMRTAEVLGALGVREATPALLTTLGDSDNYVRLYAAEALVRLGETEGRTVLRRALRHPSLSVRLYAAEALANVGDETPRFLLHRVVADPTMPKGVRLYAAWILGRLHDPSGIRYVGALLQDADPYVRVRAAWTLGEIGDLGASPVLRAALRDRERTVRIHATWALDRLLRRYRVRG